MADVNQMNVLNTARNSKEIFINDSIKAVIALYEYKCNKCNFVFVNKANYCKYCGSKCSEIKRTNKLNN